MVGIVVGACLLAALIGAGAGAALSARATRRRMSASPHTFRCKLTSEPRGREPTGWVWPRSMSHASWVHDVLVVSTGLLHTTVRPIGVHFAEGPVDRSELPNGLGREPVVLALHLDDGTRLRLAAPRRDTLVAAGPFLAAVAMIDCETAPRETS